MNFLLKIFSLLVSALLGLLTQSCVKNDDFSIPTPEPVVVELSGTKISIAALKNQFDYQTEAVITFSGTKNYIEGYVVSSDEAGNFFKELVIQDLPENPISGIQIVIDQRSLYQKYEFGRKIFVQLDGLSLGVVNGVLKLGKLKEQNIEAISEFETEKHVFRTAEVKEIIPKTLTIEDFDTSVESLYIQLNDLQFAKELIENPSKTLAGAANDRFQGERELHSCATQESMILSTSVYADFKSLTIPATQGSVKGVLSKDFFGDYYVLRMTTSNEMRFGENTRCDVAYLSCEAPTSNSRNTVLFEEGFESITNTDQITTVLGWTNSNSNGDDKYWQYRKIRNVENREVTISAYNTGLNPLEVWLVTPEINLDGTTDEVLSFEVQTSFNNGKALTVWATTSYTRDPETTKWLPLDIDLPQKTANKIKIENFPISCLNGKLHIAFRYNGRDPGVTSTYSIDKVKIYGVSK